ncbi:hypothetical protein BV20DRAFT_47324 [Pilatotrama ljubarskyi]|nr:hypothetical protein BV20DRAFT_47324 [Pilatotrama ljubarskyi]
MCSCSSMPDTAEVFLPNCRLYDSILEVPAHVKDVLSARITLLIAPVLCRLYLAFIRYDTTRLSG